MNIDTSNIATVVLIGLLITLTIAEMIFSYKENRHYYDKKDTLTNIYLASVTFFINLFTKGVTFFILDYGYRFHFVEITHPVVYWLTLIILQDLLYWFLHATGHYVRFFWAMHVTHHSSAHFNLTTGFRSTVLEPLYRVFFYLPLAFLGFTAIDILYVYLITQLYGNLVHTQANIKLPQWYGLIFVTPAHHRVHHASNLKYLDKNMGMLFIIWDRLFGTFEVEDPNEEIKYGITKPIEDKGPLNIIFHEWKDLFADVKSAPGIINKLKYICFPPGWSHDNHTQTARVLRKELKKNKNSY
jgi:sterol desaturase/sphingolipid hydroxylase (fatty acid hydroxylase superfamily)